MKVLRYGLIAIVAFWFFGGPSLVSRTIHPDLGARAGKRIVLGGALVVGALIFMGLSTLVWVPTLSNHLSTKGLIQSHSKFAQNGEPLQTYQTGARRSAYYLRNIERIKTLGNFTKKFLAEDRLFAVIPRKQLSLLNYEVRRKKKPRRNLIVLDDRSSRFLLVSNQAVEGQPNLSRVANAILPGKPNPVYTVIVKDDDGQRAYPQFDKKLQLVGYGLYHENEVDRFGVPVEGAQEAARARAKRGEPATFKTGERMVVRYYFKVLKRVSSGQKIFLHIDYPGTRINGDHVPNNGEFPTNHWLPGDYVTDTQWVDVERGSSAGTYTLYMGFFQGKKRMKVTPKSAHDGGDRIKLGTMEIRSF
jgi:hypothetical protein